jgi:hypothetical protein
MADKRSFFTWVFALNLFVANAQTFFSEQEEHLIYYSPAIAPTAVCAGDIEGDGDTDILSFFDQKFRLYNHSDGKGTFIEQEIISAPDDWILSVYISDLNGDGEEDILAASYNNNKIIWYENEGDMTFGPPKIISSSAEGAASVYAADLDKDGDADVLSASLWDNTVAWYENEGGGVFGEQQIITSQAAGARYVYVSDLNGDSLQDVLSASFYDNRISWYENTGGGVFSEQKVITDSAARAICVYTADLDGDGHKDVLSASSWDHKIAWYKNDSLGNFGAQQVISSSLKSAQSVYAADLDGDGDQDVLSASLWDNKIAWYENNGAGDFGPQEVVTGSADGPGFVYATDLDGDGYNDIISASTDFKIAWYENALPMKILANPGDTAAFPGSNAGFRILAESAAAYQWQCRFGDVFSDLANDDVYAGVNTNALEITGIGYDMQENQYRCLAINGSDSLHSKAAVLTVIDTVVPAIISSHPDTVMPSGAWCFAEIPDYTGDVEATDNSNGLLNITQTPVPWSKVYGASVEVTLSAADPAGNSSSVNFVVDVVDRTPPVLTTLSDVYQLEKNGAGQYFLPDFADSMTVRDNCSAWSAINITQEPAPGYILPDSVFELDVTMIATDEAGNSGEISVQAISGDRIPPLITSTHNDAAILGQFCLAFLPNYLADLEATDNVNSFPELILEQSPEPNSIIFGTDNQVTLTVTDRSQNSTEVTFNVVVTDNIMPVPDCVPDQIILLEEGQTAYTVSGNEFDLLSIQDNCEIVSIRNNINDSSTLDQVVFLPDTTGVVWTVEDLAGNIARCSFNVIVNPYTGIKTFRQYGISVYPNPATGELMIESLKPVQRLRILDLKGSIRMQRTDLPEKGRINIAALKGGTYILNIVTDDRAYNMKIVKE